ncbi:MAG: Maf family nucleotide pyrophosphatase [Christiangramia sp.]|uniref:Maf family nucleotide pyrophosphatase n=1 Tax=Christiangramia sp. TaxID=1931228 RepID=UPI000C559BD6|nr:septum formation protein Maf [Christiangramia sp.]
MLLKELLKDHEVILASGSPRRHRFMEQLEIPFKSDVRPIDEVFPKHLKGEAITAYLAKLKAEAFDDLAARQILITSDTIVYLNEKAMGKPQDHAEAVQMISALSGKKHEVISSVCFTTKNDQKTISFTTEVTFRQLERDEIEHYVATYKPFDKAGGYAIQEWIGLVGITSITGSYFNVVGMPTHLVYTTLKEMLSQ